MQRAKLMEPHPGEAPSKTETKMKRTKTKIQAEKGLL